MYSHSILVLGVPLNFKSEAEPERMARVCALIEDRYARLFQHEGSISKEKLLAFLSLSLADDILHLQDERLRTDSKLLEFLGNIEKVAG
jgi:Cell division protein ZapA.